MTLLVVTRVIKVDYRNKPLKPLLAVIVFDPILYFTGETFGIAATTASESGIFIACIPAACLIASSLLLQKRPTRFQVIGILITFSGVLVTVLAASVASSFSVLGYAFLILAVVSYALFSVSVEMSAAFSSTEITYAMLATGAVFFTVLALGEATATGNLTTVLTLTFMDRDFFIAILYLGIGCSILAFFMSNVAIVKIGVNRMSTFAGISTVMAIMSGALVLHERLNLGQIVGAIIIVIGVLIANVGASRYKERQETEAG